jgi:hypothetical protein
MKQILSLYPETYNKHIIHSEGRTWIETNCYTDVLVEQLHALGHEPIAALPFTLRADCEGDQWTFFKFPHNDIFDLYGLDIQELAVWRPLLVHIEELVSAERPAVLELDAWFLPDTSGSAYKLAHMKTTISVNFIDIKNKKMGYFHNQGYYELTGGDFTNIFQTEGLVHERMLPPYFEYIKREREVHLSERDLVEQSKIILKRNFALIPKNNPFLSFKERFSRDLEWLLKEDVSVFHAYSFATLRQFGACFELTETYFRWLAEKENSDLSDIINAFQTISQAAKTYQFQLARAMARNRPLDLAPIDAMAAQWQKGMNAIQERLM